MGFTNREWKAILNTLGGGLGRSASLFIKDDPNDKRLATNTTYSSFNPNVGSQEGVAGSSVTRNKLVDKDPAGWVEKSEKLLPALKMYDSIKTQVAGAALGMPEIGEMISGVQGEMDSKINQAEINKNYKDINTEIDLELDAVSGLSDDTAGVGPSPVTARKSSSVPGKIDSLPFDPLKGNIQMNLMDNGLQKNRLSYLDDYLYKRNRGMGTPNRLMAREGMRGKFTKGSKWEVVKDLKGYPSHAKGGVDIKFDESGVSFSRNGGKIKAKDGLVLPKVKAEDGVVIPNLEYEVMSKVLSQRNKHLNWIKRGLNPDDYPKIYNEDGSFSTHKLAYSTNDNGEAYVYPTIIQNDKGELEQLSDDEAWEYAKKTKTAMVIPNIKLAEYYSKNGLIKH